MAKTLAIIFGIFLVILGVLGWMPNPLVGAGAIFDTNMAHDIVHLVSGLVLLAVAFAAPRMAALGLKLIGVVYLIVAILGFVMAPNGGTILGVLTANMADHLLHAVLGVVLLVAGFCCHGMKAAPAMPSSTSSMPPANPPMSGTM
jgi:hypothetical protein